VGVGVLLQICVVLRLLNFNLLLPWAERTPVATQLQ